MQRADNILVPRVVISLAGSPGQEDVQDSLDSAAGKQQSLRGQDTEWSTKPGLRKARPVKDGGPPGTERAQGHRQHHSPLAECLWWNSRNEARQC